MYWTTQASAPASWRWPAYARSRSTAPRGRVRTRSTGVISSSKVRIGLILSVEPQPSRAPCRSDLHGAGIRACRARTTSCRASPRVDCPPWSTSQLPPAPEWAARACCQHGEAEAGGSWSAQSKTLIRSPPLFSSASLLWSGLLEQPRRCRRSCPRCAARRRPCPPPAAAHRPRRSRRPTAPRSIPPWSPTFAGARRSPRIPIRRSRSRAAARPRARRRG